MIEPRRRLPHDPRKPSTLALDVAALLGVGLVAAGAALYSGPAGLIVLGVGVLYYGLHYRPASSRPARRTP